MGGCFEGSGGFPVVGGGGGGGGGGREGVDHEGGGRLVISVIGT